jgi:hypothetical protein
VDHLHVHREILRFKSGPQPAPKGSGLAEKAFILMVQTIYQKEVFEKYGNNFMGIDATHNTTEGVGTDYSCRRISGSLDDFF